MECILTAHSASYLHKGENCLRSGFLHGVTIKGSWFMAEQTLKEEKQNGPQELSEAALHSSVWFLLVF